MQTTLNGQPLSHPPSSRRRTGIYLGVAALLTLATMAAFPYVWQSWVEWRYRPAMQTLDTALTSMAEERVAIVYGARVYPSGRLSAMLQDRVDTAIALYEAGNVQKLLFSGDNRTDQYNEPAAMMAYAIARGVPAEDIQPDYGGRRTYDTCYRAKHIFQLDAAVLVTQAFHLPRALFICDQLGMETTGVIADRRQYDPRSITWSESREVPALVLALRDVILRFPAPVLGEPIPLD